MERRYGKGSNGDFFDKHFNMSVSPEDMKDEQWKPKREKLSAFFTEFMNHYRNAIQSSGFSLLNFIMTRPFHMLFAINDDYLYFGITNHSAFLDRNHVFKLNDGVELDVDIMSRYFVYCGLGNLNTEPGIICDIKYEIVEDLQTDKIKEEAENLVDFEVENMLKEKRIMNVKPYFGDIDYKVNDNKVFMLMPFGNDEINEFYEDHIKKVLHDNDYHCMRADDIFDNKSIMADIWRNINEARIVIADLTERNPNVFYEVGIAHTLGKDVILISQEEGDIPFDLRHIRTIFYKTTTRGAKDFSSKLMKTVKTITDNSEFKEI